MGKRAGRHRRVRLGRGWVLPILGVAAATVAVVGHGGGGASAGGGAGNGRVSTAASGVGRLVEPSKLPVGGSRTPREEPEPEADANLDRQKAFARTAALPAKPPIARPQTAGGSGPRISGNGLLLLQRQWSGNAFADSTSGFFAPPDTQVAAGFDEVVETTNDTMRVYSKGGTPLATFDLSAFFGAASDQNGADNKIVFDALAFRYYMAELLVNRDASRNVTGSQIKLAVSQSANPLGSWCVYTFGFFTDTSGNLLDQPKLGFSNDKITITENTNGGSSEKMDVTSKGDALAGCAGIAGTGFGMTAFNVMPVISLSGVDDQLAVFNDGGSTASVLDITGTPGVSAVSFTQTNRSIFGLSIPPQGVQPPFPGGGTAPIDTGDNRFQTAVFQNGTIWVGADDACNPGDGNHSCMRFDSFDANNGFSVGENEIADAGHDLYDPAISVDSSGDLFFTYTISGPSTFATMQSGATTLPFSGSFPAFNDFSGSATYQCSACTFPDGSLRPRWGDYSGAARDPNEPSTIWLAAEFGAIAGSFFPSDSWDTGVAAETLDVPFTVGRSPSSGPSTGGTVVDVRGGGFVSGGTSVAFGGAAASSVSFVSTEELLATTPAHGPGHVGIVAHTANGDGTDFSLGFDYLPTVASVSPPAGPTSGGNPVHVTGSGFAGASSVSFGGTAATFTVTDDGDITATAPSHSAGTVDVQVTTNGETSPTSSGDQYTYVAPPTVTGVHPDAGPAGGGTNVRVDGTDFVSGSTVKFGGAATGPVTFVSPAELKLHAPAHAAGVVDVRVTTPGGTSATSNADKYAYGPPAVSGVGPAAGPTAGGTVVRVSGSNFSPSATVRFGGNASGTVTFVSGTQLKAVAPPHAAGTVDVTVTTGAGTSPLSSADEYTYDGPPSVTAVSPNAGATGGGNTVQITGANFVSGATVEFGSTASGTVTFVSATQLKALAPAHAAGVVDVTVSTPGGTSATSAADRYAFGAPRVSSVTPNAGATGGGNTVQVVGSSFVPGATVKFGSVAAGSVTYVSPTLLKVVAPAHAAAVVDVTVTTHAGASAHVDGDLYAFGAPAVGSISPTSGPAGGGTTVTITGKRFVPGAIVKFGSVPSVSVTFVSSTTLKARSPAHAVGTVDVRAVTDAGPGPISAADRYTYR